MIDFWNDIRPMTGMRRCDEEKMACRYCRHAEREHIGRGYCEMYPERIRKPRDVYFDNEPCPKFERGEDLLPYDLIFKMQHEDD